VPHSAKSTRKEPVSKGFFAECHHVSTRQKNPASTLTASLPSATSAALGKKKFDNSLPSAIVLHSAKKFFIFLKKLGAPRTAWKIQR
jgi:hypothetical protein